MDVSKFRVYLRAFEPEDYRVTHQWRQDEELWDSLLGYKRFVSSETERKWMLNAIELHEQGKTMRFAICLRENDKLIGMYILSDIDYINRNCATGVIIEKQSRGGGLVKEVIILAYRYVFFELGLERVYSHVIEDNMPSRRTCEAFGRKQEGVLRNAVYKNGKFKNLIVYGTLKDEFIDLYGPY